MPIYEYLCEACGLITEVMQKVADPSPRSCPECGSRKIAKLVSRSAFQLKGGGWYADLYASRKKGADAAHAESKPDAAGEKPSADSKPSADAQPSVDNKRSADAKPTDTRRPADAKPSADAKQPAEKKTTSK